MSLLPLPSSLRPSPSCLTLPPQPSTLRSSLLSLLPTSSSTSSATASAFSIIDHLIEELPSPSADPAHFEESLQIMRKVCLSQEVDIQSKMKTYRKYDIYAEFEKINSELKGLRYLKGEELRHKFLQSVETAKNSKSLFDSENNLDRSYRSSPMEKESEFGFGFLEDCFGGLEALEEQTDFNKIEEEMMIVDGFKNMTGRARGGEMSGFSQKTKKMAVDFNRIHNLLEETENLPFVYYHNTGGQTGGEENILREIDLNYGCLNNRGYFE
jgi:hypothetical protein